MATETTEFFKCKINFYQTHVDNSIHNRFCEYFMYVLLIIVFKNICFIYISHEMLGDKAMENTLEMSRI